MEKIVIKMEIVDNVNLSEKNAYFSQASYSLICMQYNELAHFSTIFRPYYYHY